MIFGEWEFWGGSLEDGGWVVLELFYYWINALIYTVIRLKTGEITRYCMNVLGLILSFFDVCVHSYYGNHRGILAKNSVSAVYLLPAGLQYWFGYAVFSTHKVENCFCILSSLCSDFPKPKKPSSLCPCSLKTIEGQQPHATIIV